MKNLLGVRATRVEPVVTKQLTTSSPETKSSPIVMYDTTAFVNEVNER